MIFSPDAAPTLEMITYTVIKVMIVSVPDNPSTPSAQFVTFMEAHTSITINTTKITVGIVTVLCKEAIIISFPL